MDDEKKLEQRIKRVNEELRERGKLAFKKAEQAFREEMERDTAGTVFRELNLLRAEIANTDALLVAANPMAALARRIANIEARLMALEAKKAEE
jgi:BMFP domain-containing protein YqiC